MLGVEHLQVQVGPDLVEVEALGAPLKMGRPGGRNVRADGRTAPRRRRHRPGPGPGPERGRVPLAQRLDFLQQSPPSTLVAQTLDQVEPAHRVARVGADAAVLGGDPAMGEPPRQRRSSDDEVRIDAGGSEVAGGGHHLLGALDQEPREADHVGFVLARRLDQLFARHLDPEVHDLEAVVRQDDVDQVLADVMNVALHGGQDDPAAGHALHPLHVRLEVIDGRLHHLGALQHLGNDQLVVVEQPSDLRHPGHQRPVDDVERIRPARVRQRRVQVRAQPLLAALDHRPRQSLGQGQQIARRPFLPTLPLPERRGERLDRALPRLHVPGPQIEQRFGKHPFRHRNLGVARKPLGVDDRRIEAGLRATVEEDRVQHLPPRERQAEAHVRDAQDRPRARERLAHRANPIDRRRRRAEVRLVARAAREDQRIPPDVLGFQAPARGQKVVTAPRDLELAVGRHRHALLVDQADDHGAAELPGERNHLL